MGTSPFNVMVGAHFDGHQRARIKEHQGSLRVVADPVTGKRVYLRENKSTDKRAWQAR